MKTAPLLGITLLAALAGASPAGAQSGTASQTLKVVIKPAASLTISPGALTFVRSSEPEPGATAPGEGLVQVRARARAGRDSAVVLTVTAQSDLTDGANTLDASNITWSASGDGFHDGRLKKAESALVAEWTGSGERSGELLYALRNDFLAAPGTYTTTLIYTLTTQ